MLNQAPSDSAGAPADAVNVADWRPQRFSHDGADTNIAGTSAGIYLTAWSAAISARSDRLQSVEWSQRRYFASHYYLFWT